MGANQVFYCGRGAGWGEGAGKWPASPSFTTYPAIFCDFPHLGS